MNKIDYDVLKFLNETRIYNQRIISNNLRVSVGSVNKSIQTLKKNKLLNKEGITPYAKEMINLNSPHNAIILAAGLGMRMTPINTEQSKGMILVKGLPLIEHNINKLMARGIKEIYIVVGFMKEQYEYLIDKYNVKLIVNNRYTETNNLYSMYLARKYIANTYILPCDIYLEENPFNFDELYSWYLFDSKRKVNTNYKIKRNSQIEITSDFQENLKPLSIAYINKDDSACYREVLENLSEDYFEKKHYYYENVLLNNIVVYKKETNYITYEINTYEDLREVDPISESLDSEIIKIICDSLHIHRNEIFNIKLSKKGMTNKSFLFETSQGKYIMRIPGEGTDQLINRREEWKVYQTIDKLAISDEVVYFNPDNGYKLTHFINNSRCCDLNNENDLTKAMQFLKQFHFSNLKVNHTFDIFGKIEFYESLRGKYSLYSDYDETKKKVYQLKGIIDASKKHWSLTHIDAITDNFLFYKEQGKDEIRLIDWEYAGMQDTDVDLAMFCIYALYNKEQVDHLINI